VKFKPFLSFFYNGRTINYHHIKTHSF
jgi:hypothetical protein